MADLYVWAIVILFYLHQLHVSAENLGFLLLENPPKIYKTTFGDSIGTLQFEKVVDCNDPRELDYDPVEKKIYWTEKTTNEIRRCDLDGNNIESFDVLSGVTGDPYGIVLDVVNRVIYYTSKNSNSVVYLDMDFVGPPTGITASETSKDPRSISHDPLTKTLYYGFRGNDEALESIQTDGNSRRTLVNDPDFTNFRGTYINGTAKELFFGAKSNSLGEAIYVMDFSGDQPTPPEVIYLGAVNTNEPYGISEYKDELYWCDGDDNNPDRLYKIAKDGSADINSPITVPATYSDGGELTACRDIHFYIETPCVLNMTLIADSSTQITALWNKETPLCPADFYKVQYESIDADQCDAEYTTTTLDWQTEAPATLMNLKPYTTYRVTVTAGLQGDGANVNAGPIRLVATQDTAEQVPSQTPPGLTHVIGEISTSFSWQEIPCGSRYGLIESYSYMLSLNDELINSGVSFTQGVILGNPSCGSVKFEVAAITAAGTGLHGNVTYDVVSTEPFDSSLLQLNAITQTSVEVSWVKTECPPSDEYTVEYTLVNLEQCLSRRIEADPITEEGSSVTLKGLEPGSDYEIVVSAYTKDSTRRHLTTKLTTLESVPMAAPMNPKTVYTNGRTAEFTWDEIPCGLRGGDSLEYFYQVLSNGLEIRSGKTMDIRVTVRDLPCGIVSFHVMGVNDAGDGPTSSTVEFDVNLSDTVRTDIQIQVAAVTSTSAYLSWEGASCPSSPFMITYELTNLEQCRQENTAVTVGPTTDSSVTLTGLSHGSSYDVTVTAPTLGFGNDLVLETSFVTADGVPTLGPSNVRLTSSDATSLVFAWDDVPCGYRGGIIMYEYVLSDPSDAFSTVSGTTPLTSVTINGLQEGRNYEFSVFAVNNAGRRVQDSVSIMSPTDVGGGSDASTAIALGFGVVGFVIIGLAAFNGFIYFRNVIQPGNIQSFNDASGLQKLPGATSPFAMQRQGLSAQFDYL